MFHFKKHSGEKGIIPLVGENIFVFCPHWRWPFSKGFAHFTWTTFSYSILEAYPRILEFKKTVYNYFKELRVITFCFLTENNVDQRNQLFCFFYCSLQNWRVICFVVRLTKLRNWKRKDWINTGFSVGKQPQSCFSSHLFTRRYWAGGGAEMSF